MNRIHRLYCRSDTWARRLDAELLPWALKGVEVGGRVLEVGPGPGLTSARIAPRASAYIAAEIDPDLARAASAAVEDVPHAAVVRADGTRLPLADGCIDVALCFTMLHHVPTPALQDELLADMARVLRPGGVLAGSDSRTSLRFRLFHIGDTMTIVDPQTFPGRLRAAGLEDVHVDAGRRSLRWRARRPGAGGDLSS